MFGWLLTAACAAAAVAAEQHGLARWVPDNAGLCVEIHDLSGTLLSLEGGPLAARWRQIPELSGVLGLIVQGAESPRAALRSQLGVTREEEATLFGGEMAVVIWPSKVRQGQGTGVLLLECDDPALLARIEKRIVDHQRRAGKLGPERTVKLRDREVDVHSIVGADGSRPQLAVVGNRALLATDDAAFEQILKGLDLKEIESPLANLSIYKTGIERLDPAAPIRAFLNPRVWDEAMQASPIPSSKRTRFVRDGILGVWEASDYCVASATLGPAVQLEMFLACEQSRLPQPFRSMAASATGPAELATRLPADSLAVVATRLDVHQMLQALTDSETVSKYWTRLPNSLGWAAAMALAGGLGPEAAVALCPAKDEMHDDSPVRLIAGLATQRVESHAAGEPVGSALLPLVRETMRWMAKGDDTHGSRPGDTKAGIQVETVKQGELELFGVAGLISNRPDARIWAVEDHTASKTAAVVWLGDSLGRVAQAAQGQTSSGDPNWRKLHNSRVGEPSDLFFFDLAGVRKTLSGSPDAAARLLAGSRGDTEAGERTLQQVLARLQAADALLGELRLDPKGLGVSLSISCD
jgi:hypothetical protein